uniref:TF-B3 domain-containing protein n=1 Tax=Arundo donax TaxID=35708 RepID=A0A0A9FAP2_ARUDO
MDVTKIRFFKLMNGDFTRAISKPEKFVKNFNGQITEGLDLKAPSGESWHVGVDKHDDELFLMSGWEDFVKAHELQENDLLLFTCSGNSSFEVLIFEASGCEKFSSLFSNKTGPSVLKHFNNMAGRHAEHCSLSDSDDPSMPSRLVGSPHNVSTSRKSSGREPESPNSSGYDVKH